MCSTGRAAALKFVACTQVGEAISRGQGASELCGLVLIYTSWGTGPNLSLSMNDHSIFLSAIKPLNKSQLKSMGDLHHFQGYRSKKMGCSGKKQAGKRKGGEGGINAAVTLWLTM